MPKGNFKTNTKRKATPGSFKKGHKQYNSGKTWFTKGQLSDDKNPSWKGDQVGYIALHDWISRKLGKPKHCAYCQTTTAKKFEWANKSRAYKRDLSDWIRLCTSCHRYYDNGKIKL